ncbi:hypothetical protein PITC_023230 [Penicillium italicum]|uniref:Uncharacterized protein n=1 Tax=Penicillium italicum TaxID=40296 RepID=A0A0A2LBB1_PENIT|nr:hypothetical protein PITC_023230 [Penicillium italicum]
MWQVGDCLGCPGCASRGGQWPRVKYVAGCQDYINRLRKRLKNIRDRIECSCK